MESPDSRSWGVKKSTKQHETLSKIRGFGKNAGVVKVWNAAEKLTQVAAKSELRWEILIF